MQKFDVYLFDFDGTLFDTLPSSKYVFAKSYEAIGYPIEEKDILGFTREPLPVSFQRIGAPKEKLQYFYYHLEQYVGSKESIDLTQMFPDTYDTIIDLKLMESTLGIVTQIMSTCEKHP